MNGGPRRVEVVDGEEGIVVEAAVAVKSSKPAEILELLSTGQQILPSHLSKLNSTRAMSESV